MKAWWHRKSKHVQQKLWFVGLWLGGITCLLAISLLIRWALK